MAGPALLQRHAHHSIHESAFGEAEELTHLLGILLSQGEHDKATRLVAVILEHWQTRTLAHAHEEEQGLYPQTVERQPELLPLVISLKRDHELLRIAVEEITAMVALLGNRQAEHNVGEVLADIFERCKILLWVNEVHSRTEETALLPD